jgi:hypothetical protein
MADLQTRNGGHITSTVISASVEAMDVIIQGTPYINVANFPVTQQVSITGTPALPNGAATESTLSTLNGKTPALGQAAMVNSSPVVIASNQSAVPVSGTFFQTTQPVSGSVSVSNFPSSQAVTGTFFQATQPVSGSVSVSNLPATQAVTGTFFQATQPVSGTVTATGTVTANIGTTNGLALDATLTGGTQKAVVRSAAKGSTVAGDVTSTAVDANTQALDVQVKNFPATQAISGTVAVSNFPATQTVSGTVTANQGGTWTVQPGNTANTTAWKVDGSAVTQPVSGTVTSNIGTLPNLTKGTQGATGVMVQQLKDAGRTAVIFSANNVASGTTGTETAITLTKSAGTGATAAAASFVITSGKTFRITSITVATRGSATATAQSTIFNLRLNTAGAVITTSTPILLSLQSATAAVASAWDRVLLEIPDGFEIAGNGTIQFGLTAASTFVTNAPTWSVNIIGFEY